MGKSKSFQEAAYFDGDNKIIEPIKQIVNKYPTNRNVQFRCTGCGLALNITRRNNTVYLYSLPNIAHGEGCIYDDSTHTKIKNMGSHLNDGDLRLNFNGLMQSEIKTSYSELLKPGITFERLHAPLTQKSSHRIVVKSAKGLVDLLTFDKETNEKVRRYLVSRNLYFYTSNLIDKLSLYVNSNVLIIDGVLDIEAKDKLVLLSPSIDRNSLVDVHVSFATHREKILQREFEYILKTKTYPGNRLIVIGKVVNSFEIEQKKIIEVEAFDLAWRKCKLIN